MPITPRTVQEKILRYTIRAALEQEKDLITMWDRIAILVDKDCKHCFKRGYTGYNQITKKYVICKCVEVEIRWKDDE